MSSMIQIPFRRLLISAIAAPVVQELPVTIVNSKALEETTITPFDRHTQMDEESVIGGDVTMHSTNMISIQFVTINSLADGSFGDSLHQSENTKQEAVSFFLRLLTDEGIDRDMMDRFLENVPSLILDNQNALPL
ncbi:hypothetical protein ACH5RR_038969 [Cinchona calisaya]|uniref:Uncharacterized protein n=1 Tax=Cinchona calisaya TaxID=153742 RepID=A0ABD2XYM4_9GENT